MKIERATLKDIPQLCGLLAVLFSQEKEFTADAKTQAKGLKQIIRFPDRGRIFVMRDGAKILGMVNMLFTVSTALGGRVGLLEDLIVHPEHRKKGIGSELLKAAIAFATAQGCRRLTLHTDAANQRAHLLYRREGFRRSEMIPLRLLINVRAQSWTKGL